MKFHAIFESKEPKTEAGFKRSNKAFVKKQLSQLQSALQRAIENDDDDHADELRDAIKDCQQELNESDTAVETRLARLKADLKELPQNPNSPDGIEALDDLRSKISRLEKQLKAKK